jgi:hypothetical protein
LLCIFGSRLGQKSMKAEQLTEGGVIFIVLVAKIDKGSLQE